MSIPNCEGRLLAVDWVDSCTSTGWMAKSYYRDERPTVCFSVGLCVMHTPEHMTLVMNDDECNDNADSGITIPLCNMTSVAVLGHQIIYEGEMARSNWFQPENPKGPDPNCCPEDIEL